MAGPRPLTEIARAIGAEYSGPEVMIERPIPAGASDPHGITFAEGPKYLELIRKATVGAAIIGSANDSLDCPVLRVEHPRQAFGVVLALFERQRPVAREIDSTAQIAPGAQIAENVSIGPYVVISEEAVVEAGTVIEAQCYVGPGCHVGAGSHLYPRVTLVQDVLVGARCRIMSGAVLGADGFGYAWDGTAHRRIPQVGRVIVGDDVEIGANTCIDRATCGETIIGSGTKIDDLVMIGHNVSVGIHSVIAGHTAIGGSTKIGANATIAGAVAIGDHITIADGVMLAGRAGVMQDVEAPGAYMGLPLLPYRDGMRRAAIEKRLPELVERIRALEAKLEKRD